MTNSFDSNNYKQVNYKIYLQNVVGVFKFILEFVIQLRLQ